MPLDDDAYLPLLRAELDLFAATVADGNLSAPVAAAPGWDVRDLVLHLGQIHRWALVAATEGRGDYEPPPGPREPQALREWFGHGAAALLGGLSLRDPAASCWTLWPPRQVRFWWRRQALEALVHRWDAQLATATPTPLPAQLAADGVDEVVSTFFPRQVALHRTVAPDRPLGLVATDTGGRWQLGSGTPADRVRGTAQDLLLLLWKRLDLSAPGLAVDGDLAAVRTVLDRPITP